MRRVLVIKLSALGDMVLAVAAFARIRQAHPEAHITLLTTPLFADFAAACPFIDAVRTDGRPAGVFAGLRLIGDLRSARYDRVYDLQTNDRTNLIFQAMRPWPPAWSGTAWGCAFSHDDPERMKMHTLERQAAQLAAAGIWPDAPTTPGSAPAPDISWLIGPAPPREDLALLVPGGSAQRPAKRWPALNYGIIAKALIPEGYQVAIVGGDGERALAESIRALAPAAQDLTGQTNLADIAQLGARASLAIGNDTGPMHLIAAAGAPSIVLFSGVSDPSLCAPRGYVRIIREGNLRDLQVEAVLTVAFGLLRPQS